MTGSVFPAPMNVTEPKVAVPTVYRAGSALARLDLADRKNPITAFAPCCSNQGAAGPLAATHQDCGAADGHNASQLLLKLSASSAQSLLNATLHIAKSISDSIVASHNFTPTAEQDNIMKLIYFIAFSAIAATPAFAENTRRLDAHEHGVGQLDIAFEGQKISLQFHAPGLDIVGFEYAPESAEDRSAVDAAVAMLARPLDLFVLPDAAGCSVVQAAAELESGDDHDDHGARHEGETQGNDDHDDHANEAGHTEFHAEYLLTCANPAAVTDIQFAYFEVFPNAKEVEVQLVSETGALSFEVQRDAPELDLNNMF